MSFDLVEMLRRFNAFNGGLQAPPDPNPYGIIDESGAIGRRPNMGGFDFDMFGQRPENSYNKIDFGGARPLGDVVSSQYEEIDPIDFTPEDQYSKMFGDLLKQMPQHENPSMWRRIAAIVGGGLTGNLQGVDEVMHGKHRRKMQDWKGKVDVVGRAATDERARNQQERMWNQSRQSAELRERDLNLKEQRDRTRAEIDRQKLELANFKARNPNWVLKEQRGGNIIAFNPQNPAEVVDTGVATGTLSDLDKINLGLQRDLTMESVRQTNRVGLEGVRQAGRERMVPLREASQSKLITQRGEEARRTRVTPPGRAPGGSANVSPAGEARALVNRANQLINNNPGYDRYITVDGLNVRVNAPGGWGRSSPDAATHAKIMQELYGSTGQPSGPVMMVGPDGKSYEVPADKVADAEKRGMRRRQ